MLQPARWQERLPERALVAPWRAQLQVLTGALHSLLRGGEAATRAARDFLSGRAAEEVDAANERYGYGVMRGRPARTSYHSENPRSVLDYYDPSGASEPASEPASSSRKRRGAP